VIDLAVTEQPVEWIEMSEACSDPDWVDEFAVPNLADAREFVEKGTHVSGGQWHYFGLWVACEYSGVVILADQAWSFNATPTGMGQITRLSDGYSTFILCYDCIAWHHVDDCTDDC
jgi:hypothetical protein